MLPQYSNSLFFYYMFLTMPWLKCAATATDCMYVVIAAGFQMAVKAEVE